MLLTMIINRWKLVVLILAIFLSVFGFIFLKISTGKKSTHFTSADYDRAKIHPQARSWSKYREIGKEFAHFIDFPANSNTNEANEKVPQIVDDGEISINKAIELQISEVRRMFSTENLIKRADFEKEISEFEEKLKHEIDIKFQDTLQRLTDSLNLDIQQKKSLFAKNLAEYRRGLLGEQQVNLSSLQLKLYIIDLSNDLAEKNRLRDQTLLLISQIRQDMEIKYVAEEQKLRAQLDRDLKQLRKQFDDNLNTFKDEQEQYYREQVNALKKRLEDEYLEWYVQREGEVQKAIKLREVPTFDYSF
ncbi:hypothetical protein EDC14_102761 [Hydrogenispora ethanolica]|uniref:Uncharacterized protein n=1 Tax=Hydrogenispora ethanolica TaxID=1082276 RepID=A0A4R1R9G4_HYDET|nr:hypothetical protein EDC14_102761 [Hydrogenispora ethanolica]